MTTTEQLLNQFYIAGLEQLRKADSEFSVKDDESKARVLQEALWLACNVLREGHVHKQLGL